MPLFLRDGAIVPLGPELQCGAQKPADPIELRVYPRADGAFTLYEDEEDNTNYLRGKYGAIPINWDHTRKALTLGRRTGSFAGMLKTRTFQVVWVGTASSPATKTVTYTERH